MPPIISIGRLAVKLRGRDAGRKCVLVGIIDKNFVLVTGPKRLTGVRRRKVNIDHLLLLPQQIKISKNASDDEVIKALEEANLLDFMKEGFS
ncbi:MAG TPA: 50S ribosomal protein L14e [Geobacterales bacterium]|nr:50S ribosomal protein L14e [Geobacterales bacterium]